MDIANLVIRVTNDGLAATTAELRRLREQAANAENQNGRLGSSFDRLKSVAAGLFATVGIAKLGSDLISTQRQFDVLNAQLITATGSTAAAAVEFKKLQEFAAQTPYDLGQAVDGFAKLKNLGLDPSMKSMESFGNTASAMGKDLNQMIEAVADASTGEFERLKEFGIKSKSEGDKVSFTFQGITTTVGKNAKEIQDYLLAIGETNFAGAMATRMDTLDGAFSNLGDSYSNLLLQLSGAGVGDAMKDVVLGLSGQLDALPAKLDAVIASLSAFNEQYGVIDKLKQAWDNLQSVIDRTGEILKPIVDFFREHEELSKSLATAIGIVAGAFVIYNAAVAIGAAVTGALAGAFLLLTSPIALTVIAITALVAAGVYLYRNWDEIKAKATEIWGAITTYISNKINEIKNYFSTNFPAMTAIVSGSIEIIKTLFVGGFNLIKNTVTTVLGVIKAVISGDFKAIPSIIGNGLKAAASIVGSMMTNILNIIKEAGKKLFSIGRDFIQGFINGIKSVGSGVVSAASSMVGNAIAAVKKRQDSASPSKVTTKLGGDFSQGMANGIKKGAKAVKSEAQKMAEQAIETVKNSIASLQKEIALFGNDSPLASFNFDVGVGKFAGVPDSLLDKNRELITQRMRLIELDKQQAESVKLLAKARESIQERFAKLKTDQEASGKAVDGVMGELQAETAIGKIQADYERRIEVIRKHEELTTGLIGSEEAKRVAIYESAQKAKELIQIQGNEKLFGELSSITKTFFGEQSAAHRAMFAVEKYFALKRILVENKVALAKAWASAAFPYNLPAIATVAAQTGLLAAAVKGFKQGGYTGNMGASQVAGVVHGQEYVFDAQSTKRIGVDNLNAMRSGKAVGGGDVNITVNNMSSAKVETQKDDNGNIVMTIRDEIKRSWTNTGNPNSFESKQLNRNIQAPRRR